MILDSAARVIIIGNSGSGKSTLAERLGAPFNLPTHDLDDLHWRANRQKRDETEATALATQIAAGDAWVIEGVYGWLAAAALPRATALIWLDLPWSECHAGLAQRGLRRGMEQSDQDALLAWAGAYWTRTTPSSFAGHRDLYERFDRAKARLRTRADLPSFLASLGSRT
jgi:adenylate kinase family enzyme